MHALFSVEVNTEMNIAFTKIHNYGLKVLTKMLELLRPLPSEQPDFSVFADFIRPSKCFKYITTNSSNASTA